MQAAELYDIEDRSSEANECRFKTGQINAGLENLAVAIEIFESIAESQVESGTQKHSAKRALLNAGHCRLNGEA